MLIGAQQVWAYFRKKKFAKVCALAVSFPRTSGGAKEWQIGRHSRSSQSWERRRLVHRRRRSAPPRARKQPPSAVACRGTTGKSVAFSTHSSRHWYWYLRNRAKRAR